MNKDLRRLTDGLIAGGDHEGLLNLAKELFFAANDLPAAEEVARAARDAGSSRALPLLAIALDKQGRFAEAESAYREAIAAGHDESLLQLADMLFSDQPRLDEAEELARRGAELGAISSNFVLGKILARQPGREAEAEASLAAEVHPDIRPAAQFHLGQLLMGIPGREADAERALRDSGIAEAQSLLSALLHRIPGREEDRIEALRRAAEGGAQGAWNSLTIALKELGRLDSAEAAFRDGITRGATELLPYYGDLLRCQGRPAEAEEVLRAGLPTDPKCAWVLGVMLLEAPGRVDEGRELLIQAAGAGVVRAAIVLAQPR
ncbi:hypothetical protein GCM10009837_84500 [Streptomyces durmitorensis]|uniref:Tetratricopeptide repeat protein n=1 Tax=Streptomyces durmitorensis TaxID=319947 RepID=A0ABY4PNY1_9ACTN|nr:tetratricopeptide repeat protein [Streptomyces durmitorensis]UQT54723.1 tetratricopeptide repeat protein [Streptomyces durmitorensis]